MFFCFFGVSHPTHIQTYKSTHRLTNQIKLKSTLMDLKCRSVQELRSTFSHIKAINIDFSLVWFVSLCVDL